MAQEKVFINSKEAGLPVGRMVMGSLYKPNTTDFEGKPLVIKTGPNAGKPRVQYFMALAIPKGTERHWAETTWGAKIWAIGHQAFPQAAQRSDFAWKVADGDSQVPGKGDKARRPCDNEGWPGHWVLKLSQGFAPAIYRFENNQWIPETTENFVKPGHFVEVSFNVDGNESQGNPGVYLNLSMVGFRAFGPEINFGPDVTEAGFGQAPLPAGASLTPPASTVPPPAPAAAGPGGYPPPPAPQQAAPPVPVYPNPGFLQMPPPPVPTQSPNTGAYPVPAVPAQPTSPVSPAYPSNPAPPPPPLVAPAAPAYHMTPKANGASREACLTAGWTDAQLIQQGYMSL